MTETPADEGASHIATCAPVRYLSQPPSSGTHYPSWAVFRVYDKPVPWGFLAGLGGAAVAGCLVAAALAVLQVRRLPLGAILREE